MSASTNQPSDFWRQHRGLVWSNPAADDSTHIRAALLRPQFGQLLDIVRHFGLARVRHEWDVLKTEGTPGAQRAAAPVERILINIEKGFALAAVRD